MLPALFSEFDIIEVPDWRVRGDSPANKAKCPGVGKADKFPTVMRICAAAFGPIPGMDSRICVWNVVDAVEDFKLTESLFNAVDTAKGLWQVLSSMGDGICIPDISFGIASLDA